MWKVRIAIVGLALLTLVFTVFPFIAGGLFLFEWSYAVNDALRFGVVLSKGLLGFSAVMFLAGGVAIVCALWLIVRGGLAKRSLWVGGVGCLLSGAALFAAVATKIYPCSGPT